MMRKAGTAEVEGSRGRLQRAWTGHSGLAGCNREESDFDSKRIETSGGS